MRLPFLYGVNMKKTICTLFLVLASCSSHENYIIDPRASKDPRELVRDKLECREITKTLIEAKNEKIFGFIPFCKSSQCMRFADINYDPLKKCLVNRGHSVLN